MKRTVSIFLSLLSFGVWLACLAGNRITLADEPALPSEVQFNRDIRPILSDNCYACHGPDANHRQAELRLDVRDEAITKKAIVPGRLSDSKLIERIMTTTADEVMPPPESHKQLSDRQKSLLRLWIEQGAEYQQHWAYESPQKTETPSGVHPIDFLVRERLSELDMSLSVQAEPRILIRRLYADLLGVPPSPQEVKEFIDDCSDGSGALNVIRTHEAYLRLVDRVLANPHFGERMAMQWLDVVRFADTIGYHSDNPRNVWPYRDWVIKSFNTNKPFDRFTLEQIAGDLMPDRSQETLIGSAFNRLLLSTEEGGAQPKDYEARMLTDRVRAIGAAWLGQTTGCAQCHDHKFDPFTSRDFYALGAFFADIEEPIIGRREDGMVVGSEAEQAELARLDSQLAEAKAKRDAILPSLNAAQLQWEHDLVTYNIVLPELASDSKASDAEKNSAKQVTAIAKKKPADRKPKENSQLESYFRDRVTPLFAAERAAVATAERERQNYYDKLPKCLVSKSATNKRIVRLLPRGNWMDETGEIIKPGFPNFLPKPEPVDRDWNRLDLAHWLVSKDNPLTARTVMNRLWKQCFGMGLSKVLDDLGAQGELPPNLPLLDWLACEFMDSGWDYKHMVKTIVISETYRQSSIPKPDQLATDPENREHARQSAYRLDAELIRDVALSVSGLLNPDIGGPSVKPYQPEGYWENLNFPTRNYVADQGGNQYRRGLYTWWQRSFPHPSLLAFDAPTREECCADRNRSNIPQQALVLLNDPTYVEAARGLATRILTDRTDTESRLEWAWQLVLQRSPTAQEKETMRSLIAKQQAWYQSNKKDAQEFIEVGFKKPPESMDSVELAVWTHVARVLLNLHETITRT
jgi:mono/diheme cytochrome c family protein